jgi:hypothetical protein
MVGTLTGAKPFTPWLGHENERKEEAVGVPLTPPVTRRPPTRPHFLKCPTFPAAGCRTKPLTYGFFETF